MDLFKLLLMLHYRAVGALHTLFCMHKLTDAHNWLASLRLTGERICHLFLPSLSASFAHLVLGHGWLWHRQDSNLQSLDDGEKAFQLHHMAFSSKWLFWVSLTLKPLLTQHKFLPPFRPSSTTFCAQKCK